MKFVQPLSLTLFISVILWAGIAQAQDLKVGVVDFTQALQETESDDALAKLEKEADKKQKKLTALENEIVALEQELQENGPLLSEEKAKEKMMEYQKKALEYRKMVYVFEQEFGAERTEVLREIHEAMSIIAVEIAQEEGLDLMLERNQGVLYFNGTFDYTKELIKRYNAKKGR